MIFDITKEQFSRKVEGYVKSSKYTYIEAVIQTLEDYSLDTSQAGKLLTQPLLEKIEQEGLEINLIRKKRNKLPFA
jgi:hypothetical protein